jgi:DNA-binding FadR family transcriptional regulator
MRTRVEAAPAVVSAIAEIADHSIQVDDLKSDHIVQALERQILSGRLPAGERLPTEDELSELLRVSRSVVRAAIRTLTARGLLSVRQGRGTSVTAPSNDAYSGALLVLLARSELTMGDVVRARATIETRLSALAATSCTDEDLAALEESLDRFAAAVDANDETTATQAHVTFHKTILEAIHQPALNLILTPMTEIIVVSSAASLRHGIPEDWEVDTHRPILAALQARDPDATVAAMTAHFELSTRPVPYSEFLERKFHEVYFGPS